MSERIDLTDEDRENIEKLAGVLNQEQLADFLGFDARTLRNIFNRDPEALSAYKRGRASAIANVGKGLLQAALDGDAVRQMFYLKTQAGWKETQTVEVAEAKPIDGFLLQRAKSPDADAD